MKHNQVGLLVAALVACAARIATAAPYYYYYADAPAAAEQVADKPADLARQASDKGQQVYDQAKGSLEQAAQSVQQQMSNAANTVSGAGQTASGAANSEGQLPSRIQGHLSELYSHGSSAVRGVVDKVQPDFKNIGKDLTDVYQATRNEMGKRIEPLAHTVRPFIDQAQKAVAPYVNQAREEVPKLINSAGPALSKVGDTVRDGINGVWSKIGSGGQQQAGSSMKNVQEQVQAGAEQAKQHVSNAVNGQQTADANQAQSDSS